MVELAVLVIEAKQQGPDLRPVGKIAEAADDAVGRPHPLDLHHGTLAGQIGIVKPLRDNAIRLAARRLQPCLGLLDVQRGGRELDTCGSDDLTNASRAARRSESGRSRRISPSVSASMSNSISLAGVSAASLRMRLSAGCKTHLQGVEGIVAGAFDQDFAVDDELRRRNAAQAIDEFRKITCQRLSGLGANVDRIAGFESEAAKAIPLRLILPDTRPRQG